jgi:hypothetical protein
LEPILAPKLEPMVNPRTAPSGFKVIIKPAAPPNIKKKKECEERDLKKRNKYNSILNHLQSFSFTFHPSLFFPLYT